MSATSPDVTQFETTQPGGTGPHSPHSKVAWGAGVGAAGVATPVADTDAARLPVGGAAIGLPGDAATVNSLIGLLKKLTAQLPTLLSVGGFLKTSIEVDNSGVPTGQAVMASSVPVTMASNQVPPPGATIHRLISAGTTNATSVKASPGQLLGGYVWNNNVATRFLKLYNKASAPTVGTDTPVLTLPLPGGAAVFLAAAFANGDGSGAAFATGIAYALTTGVADSDTGAVAANDIVVNLTTK